MSAAAGGGTVVPFEDQDLASWLVHLAQRRGAHPFLVWAPFEGAGATWTYASFLEDVRRIAGGLAARGVGTGDRVLLHLENCPEALLVRFACAWLGAVCVATNTAATGAELRFFAEASAAVAAVTQAGFAPLVDESCAALHWIGVIDDAAGPAAPSGRVVSFSALRGDPAPQRRLEGGSDASIMYTTGSTARPKGVTWTHANMLWAARLNAQQQGMRAEDVHLVFLPLFHVVGLSWAVLSTMWAGGTVVLQPRFSRSRYWPAALRHAATVGSHVNFTTRVLSTDPVPAHAFRLWITPQMHEAQQAHFGIPFVAGWGMTEVLAQVIVSEPGWPAASGAIGRASLAYELRVEGDDGAAVRAPGSGHLLVRGVPGLSLFREYDGDAPATAAAFDAAGFFATGDRVRLDTDGSIFFEERLKDVIKVRGENVSALEVEQVIARLDGIREVAVVGKPDLAYGEKVLAFVVPDPPCGPAGNGDLVQRVRDECERRLSRFKRPHEVRVIEALPRIGVGKVAKSALRELALQEDGDRSTALPRSLVGGTD